MECDGWYKQKECNMINGETTTKGVQHGNLTNHNTNPHISRGMQGCIEWPKCIPKTNSKVIPLEERMKNQKSQLQHILKPKAF
jgi:hypothetical protein